MHDDHNGHNRDSHCQDQGSSFFWIVQDDLLRSRTGVARFDSSSPPLTSLFLFSCNFIYLSIKRDRRQK